MSCQLIKTKGDTKWLFGSRTVCLDPGKTSTPFAVRSRSPASYNSLTSSPLKFPFWAEGEKNYCNPSFVSPSSSSSCSPLLIHAQNTFLTACKQSFGHQIVVYDHPVCVRRNSSPLIPSHWRAFIWSVNAILLRRRQTFRQQKKRNWHFCPKKDHPGRQFDVSTQLRCAFFVRKCFRRKGRKDDNENEERIWTRELYEKQKKEIVWTIHVV